MLMMIVFIYMVNFKFDGLSLSATTGFGSSGFGAQTPSSGGLFGGSTTGTTGGLFGQQSTNTFGQQLQQTSGFSQYIYICKGMGDGRGGDMKIGYLGHVKGCCLI